MSSLSKMVEGSQILQLLKSIDYQKLVEYFSDRRIIAGVSATYIALKVLVAFLFDPLKHIPGPWWARFTNLPFSLKIVQGKIYFALAEYHKKYGPTVRLGPKFVSITTMSDAKQILATYKHPKSMEYEKFGLVPPNLFNTTNEAFNRMRRRQVGPVFTFTGLANMEDQILEDGFISLKRKLESLIGEGDSARINYYTYFQGITTDVIGHMIFGKPIGAVNAGGHPLTKWVSDSITVAAVNSKFPFMPYLRKYLFFLQNKGFPKYEKFREDAINTRYAEISKVGAENVKQDILQMFIENKDSITGKPITKPELHSELIAMLSAGIDTTSITMTYVLHVCTLFPDIYKKIVEEIDREFPDRTKLIRVNEGRKKLTYFTAVVLETMRFKTVVGGTFPRDSSDDGFQLSDYYIPPKHIINIYLEGIHYNEAVWKDPYIFNPDRFLGLNGEEMKKEIITFSSGVRICVGRNLAWSEIYTVLGNLIREYEFDIPSDCKYRPSNINPATGQPHFFKDKVYVTRSPLTPDQDCNIIVRRRPVKS